MYNLQEEYKELVAARKSNYWRGFRAACITLSIPLIIQAIVIHKLITISI